MKGLIQIIIELLFGKKLPSPNDKAKTFVKNNSSDDNDLLSEQLRNRRRN